MNAVDQARALAQSGRLEQARQTLSRALQRAPGDAGMNALMCRVLAELGQFQQASYFGERAVTANPRDLATRANLAQIVDNLGQSEKAMELVRRGLELSPADVPCRAILTDLLAKAERFVEAADTARAGLAGTPADPELSASAALALSRLGRIAEAVDVVDAALARHPRSRRLLELMGVMLNYDDRASRERTLEIHRRHARELPQAWPTVECWRGTQEPERPVRVGFVSSDLREHSVGFFARAIFTHLDRAAFRVHAYAHVPPTGDAIEGELKGLADEWAFMAGAAPAAWAERLRRDCVDVLIDLNGLTMGNLLPAFSRRMAAVQLTYLGYPNTTGVATIDERLVDATTDPPGAEAWCVEHLRRIDGCFVCYSPPSVAPEPGLDPGPITFACFNAVQKVSPTTLGLWSRVLSQSPGSRLMLKNRAFAREDGRKDMAQRLAAAGIDPSRVDLLGWTDSTASHLALYRKATVALDTFPYHGTTTTCEALFMGVPVVTLEGDRHASRVGVSLLRSAGLGDFMAATPEAYIRLATDLAADRARVETLRASLRARLTGSVVCDGPGFAGRFGAAIRAAWRRYCSGG